MISVVIPAYNEEKSITRTLESLVVQKTKETFEVIVVNNNSTDTTVEKANKFKKKLNLRVISELKPGCGAARARGFEEARGEVILTTDADTSVPPNWVEVLSNTLKTENLAAVTSPCDIDSDSAISRIVFRVFQRSANEGYRLVTGNYWLSGFSYGLLRKIYEKSGKIDTDIRSLDDIEFGLRVAKIGKIRCIYNLPVLSSSRRYEGNLLLGLASYVKPFLELTVFKKRVVMTAKR